MRYSQPSILAIRVASLSIMGGSPKNIFSFVDNATPHLHNATMAAYEADE